MHVTLDDVDEINEADSSDEVGTSNSFNSEIVDDFDDDEVVIPKWSKDTLVKPVQMKSPDMKPKKIRKSSLESLAALGGMNTIEKFKARLKKMQQKLLAEVATVDKELMKLKEEDDTLEIPKLDPIDGIKKAFLAMIWNEK